MKHTFKCIALPNEKYIYRNITVGDIYTCENYNKGDIDILITDDNNKRLWYSIECFELTPFDPEVLIKHLNELRAFGLKDETYNEVIAAIQKSKNQ